MSNKDIDYYKVLGTTIEAVYSNEHPTEFEKNQFIKRCYRAKKKTTENLKKLVDLNTSNAFKKLLKYGEDLKQYKIAYETIKTEKLRTIYNRELQSQEKQERIEEQKLKAKNSEEKNKEIHNEVVQEEYAFRIAKTKEEQFRESMVYVKEDPYQLLGTSKQAVDMKSTNKEKDVFLQERYEYKISRLQEKMKRKLLPQEIEQVRKEIENCEKAYATISSPILREEYDRNRTDSKEKVFIPKSAYDVLRLSRKKIQGLSMKETDTYILETKKKLIEDYNQMKKDARTSEDVKKIEIQIRLVEEAFDLVKSVSRRNQYDAFLQRREAEQDRQVKMLAIEKRYNHISEYNPNLIDNIKPSKTMSLENKAVIRKEIDGEQYFYMDRNNRNLRIRKTAQIGYRSWERGISSIDEYEVIRTINGKEKRDLIYTNLNIAKLSTNPETKRLVDPYYYDCVINQLLSEDTIEGSKCNGGFIGSVVEDKQGNYRITLDQKRLSMEEQEMLTAILILNQREQQIEGER